MGTGLFLQAEEQPWIIWSWLFTHVQLFVDAIEQHLLLTVIAVGLGLAISLPLAVLAHRWRRLRNPVLSVSGIFYTIPSLAIFSVLVPYTGLSVLTAEIGLVGYTVLILIRNILVGLEAVPADVIDAADGMGYRRTARLLRVELPLALPAIFAGVRIATVSTIGLITITAIIGLGGLGQLIYEGLIDDFRTPLLMGTLLSIVLALVADLTLAGVQRLAVPWART